MQRHEFQLHKYLCILQHLYSSYAVRFARELRPQPFLHVVFTLFLTPLSAVWRASRRPRSRSGTTTRPPCPAASPSTRARAIPPSPRPASQVLRYLHSQWIVLLVVSGFTYVHSRIPSDLPADTRLTLSPLRGSDLFQDSFTTQDFDAFNLRQFTASRTPSRPTETPNDFSSIKPMTPSPPRPDTGDFALKEYFASRMVQQELFDLENFSLNSADDGSGLHEIAFEGNN